MFYLQNNEKLTPQKIKSLDFYRKMGKVINIHNTIIAQKWLIYNGVVNYVKAWHFKLILSFFFCCLCSSIFIVFLFAYILYGLDFLPVHRRRYHFSTIVENFHKIHIIYSLFLLFLCAGRM